MDTTVRESGTTSRSHTKIIIALFFLTVFGCGVGPPLPPAASPFAIEIVSISSTRGQGNDTSSAPSISADGRFVVFSSGASNLVPNDTNGFADIFIHDRETGGTERVSVDSAGNEADNSSDSGMISANGQFVGFHSRASNLVPGDTNAEIDVFIQHRETGRIERVSVGSDGKQGNGFSLFASLSANGRFVAFHSNASNLVPEDTNNEVDIFVHDRETGRTERVSVDNQGNQSDAGSAFPSISANGRFVAFLSMASNLVADDSNGIHDIFVHDREGRSTERVSLDSEGNQGHSGILIGSINGMISADGRFVVFDSEATNLVAGDTNGAVDIFIHDRETGETERISVGDGGFVGNRDPSISRDGRYVVFQSLASTYDPSTFDPNENTLIADIFVHDRKTSKVKRVNLSPDGEQGNDSSFSPSISSDGQLVVFWSKASNLVEGDVTSGDEGGDVFVALNPLYEVE